MASVKEAFVVGAYTDLVGTYVEGDSAVVGNIAY
jgi:hypothetical protein